MFTNNYWNFASDIKEDLKKKDNDVIVEKKSDVWKNKEDDVSYDYVVVSLMPEKGVMSQILLPKLPEGKYIFEKETNEKIRNSIAVQSYKDKWFLYSIKPVCLYEGKSTCPCSNVELENNQIINVKNCGENCIITVEYIKKEALRQRNYRISDTKIIIGNSEGCDIIYRNKYVNSKEAELYWCNNNWNITVYNNAGFTFVNGKRVKEAEVKTGDVIYILGLKLIIGIGFVSINDEKMYVMVKSHRLVKMGSNSESSYFKSLDSVKINNELFNRLPRRRLPLKEKEIRIDSPPMSLNGDKIPLLLRMGGSMVMGTSSMFAGNPMMMITSVLFPVMNSKYSEKQKKEYEERRTKKYTEYLEKVRIQIEEERKLEEEALNYNYPELQHVLSFPGNGTRLWERRKTDDDFLNIRVGVGSIPLQAQYVYSKERFSLDRDILEDKMYALVNEKVECQNVPIMNCFRENYISGILGNKNLTFSFIKNILMQLVISHSYDEVKVVFLINESDLEKNNFIKYIPHVWDNNRAFRFIATNTGEVYQISKYLKKEFGDEINNDANKNKSVENQKKRPYYFVFAIEKRLFDSAEVLKDFMQLETNIGLSIVTAFDDLPKECLKIFQLQENGNHIMTHLRDVEKEDICFRSDYYEEAAAEKSMRKLSNISLKVLEESFVLPKMYTFLEMFDVGKIEHLNSLQRWKENNPVRTLKTPVGIGTDGTKFSLDLHQKFHGPHGLIAGMTGSGKSEFIITYILSMAINYHPDEVAFLLIDYKGGGLTSAFENPEKGICLPHLMGTITNLDGAAINRSLISIQSEMTRRQQLFKKATSIVDESTIDIYSYQKMYRNGQVTEPLPHLFIIADEFAEMKQQQPQFMDSLISIARIGRSLGVHLILATQKPSGVVNDQIRSNTKFRVCLKVQDKSDSMDMLKRPEGAELKETGRFYLQVGYNEFFALGQSAWAGADYEPQTEKITQKDDAVVFIDNSGQSIHEAKPHIKRYSTGKSQLAEVVTYLSEMADLDGVTRKRLWEEPLSNAIDYQNIVVPKEAGKINVYIGQIDDPGRQKQYPFIYDCMQCNNMMVVGEGKCGKTTMIQSMIFQLTTLYEADEVNYYILDFSSHLFKLFKNVPHCGAVLTENDEDVMARFFDLIDQIANERKALFEQLEVDSFKNAREKKKIPLILIFIDNINGLASIKGIENIYYNLNSFMKKVSNYGISFVISCSHLNEVPSRIRQEISECFALTMKDKYAYQDAIGCKIDYVPPVIPGRGLINLDGNSLEMQMSIVGAGLNDNERTLFIREKLEAFENQKKDNGARKLVTFSASLTYKEFSETFALGRFPIGYSTKNAKAVALPLKQFNILSLYFGNQLGRVPILENFLYRAFLENMKVTVIKKDKDSVFQNNMIGNEYLEKVHVVECEENLIYDEIKDMLLDMINDKHFLLEYCQENKLEFKEAVQSKDFSKQTFSYTYERMVPRLLVIESVKDLCEVATDEVNAVINSLASIASLYNTYMILCYEPDDTNEINTHPIYRFVNNGEMVLLFGGCYNRQELVEVDYGNVSMQKPIDYNQGIMRYRGNIYPIMMPCGEIIREEIEMDDVSIF